MDVPVSHVADLGTLLRLFLGALMRSKGINLIVLVSSLLGLLCL